VFWRSDHAAASVDESVCEFTLVRLSDCAGPKRTHDGRDPRRNMHQMFATSRATGDRDHRFEMTAARTQMDGRRVPFVRRNRTERRPGDPTRGARHEQEVIRAPLVFGLPAVLTGQQQPSVWSSHTRKTPVLSEGGLSHIYVPSWNDTEEERRACARSGLASVWWRTEVSLSDD
jgi:hypothetical protein